jgi:Tfp pilus assembly protein PilN
MLNINFVPDDYIQNSESRKTNLTYLMLFIALMAVLGGSFVTIKIRQRGFNAKEKLVNAKMSQAQEAIKQFEQLQTKRKTMMKTVQTTVALLEPVPRSVLLASLTNSLPAGVSLLQVNIIQKESIKTNQIPVITKYKATQNEKMAESQPKVSQEKQLETHIDIEGIAPSDRQVADYIGQLSSSFLLDNVELVESKEYKIEDTTLRQFKLTAMLRNDVHLTNEDIKKIKHGA